MLLSSGGIAQYEINAFVLAILGVELPGPDGTCVPVILEAPDAFGQQMVFSDKRHLPKTFLQKRIVLTKDSHIKCFATEALQALTVLCLFFSTQPRELFRGRVFRSAVFTMQVGWPQHLAYKRQHSIHQANVPHSCSFATCQAWDGLPSLFSFWGKAPALTLYVICNILHTMRDIEVNNIEEECIYEVNKSVTNAGRGVVAPFY